MVDKDGGLWGPAQPSPTIGQCLNGGLGWLEVECHRCKTRASLPLDAIRRPRDTPLWKPEASLKCRSCRKGRYAPPVHMIKLTQQRELSPYVWCIRTKRDDWLFGLLSLRPRRFLSTFSHHLIIFRRAAARRCICRQAAPSNAGCPRSARRQSDRSRRTTGKSMQGTAEPI